MTRECKQCFNQFTCRSDRHYCDDCNAYLMQELLEICTQAAESNSKAKADSAKHFRELSLRRRSEVSEELGRPDILESI